MTPVSRTQYAVCACLCESMTFRQWLDRVEANSWTLREAREKTRCGETCGICRPYLRVVKATGRTELPIMHQGEIDLLYPLTEEE